MRLCIGYDGSILATIPEYDDTMDNYACM